MPCLSHLLSSSELTLLILIELLPSQYSYSGDIKLIRNMCNLRFFGYLKIDGRFCNAAILELMFCIGPSPEFLIMRYRNKRVILVS